MRYHLNRNGQPACGIGVRHNLSRRDRRKYLVPNLELATCKRCKGDVNYVTKRDMTRGGTVLVRGKSSSMPSAERYNYTIERVGVRT